MWASFASALKPDILDAVSEAPLFALVHAHEHFSFLGRLPEANQSLLTTRA